MRKQIEMEGEQTVGQNQKNTQEPDMNQLRKVRREKLAELQQNGRDPFQITKLKQTNRYPKRFLTVTHRLLQWRRIALT